MKRLLKQMALLLSVTVILIFGYCQQQDTRVLTKLGNVSRTFIYMQSHTRASSPRTSKVLGYIADVPHRQNPMSTNPTGNGQTPKMNVMDLYFSVVGRVTPHWEQINLQLTNLGS